MVIKTTVEQTVSVDGSRRQVEKQRKHARVDSDGHHKPKRAKQPRHFKEWDNEDRHKYNQITLFLRLLKATQKQCQYYRYKIGFWAKLKMLFESSPGYNKEISDFYKLKKEYRPIPKSSPVDLPPFE